MRPVQIGVIGDFNPTYVGHVTTDSSLRDSADRLGVPVTARWLPTDSFRAPGALDALDAVDGLWISAGSPYRYRDGALAAIRFARERGKPMVAT